MKVKKICKGNILLIKANKKHSCRINAVGKYANAGDELRMKVPCRLHLSRILHLSVEKKTYKRFKRKAQHALETICSKILSLKCIIFFFFYFSSYPSDA